MSEFGKSMTVWIVHTYGGDGYPDEIEVFASEEDARWRAQSIGPVAEVYAREIK